MIPRRLSLVWFFLLGGLGLFLPYFSLYLGENAGLSDTRVGIVIAVVPLSGILAQLLWGQVADRSGTRTRVLLLLLLGAALGYANLFWLDGFSALIVGTACLAVFSTALIPTCVSVTLELSDPMDPHAFGRRRVWGTIGFAVVVTGFPLALDAIQRARGLSATPGGPSEPGLEVMFPIAAGLMLLSALVARGLPREGREPLRAPRGDWRRLLRHGPFVRVLLFVLFAYFFLQGPMTLFPLFVRSHGGTIESVSRMWILMLILEVPLVAYSGVTLARLGPRGLLAMGIVAGGVRWLVCGLAPSLAWVYPVQVLHGLSVAGLVIGAPLYVEAVVPERLRATGQGMLAMMGTSLGGICSSLTAGWLLEHVGASAPYLSGGIGALVLALLLPLWTPLPSRPE